MLKRSQIPLKSNKPLSRGTSKLSKGSSKLSRGKGLKTRKKTPEDRFQQQARYEKDIAFYQQIWNENPHICRQCGNYLGDTLSIAFMDHMCEKAKHPELRYEKENIFICCIDCHYKRTNGFPGDKHKEAIKQAKITFNI